jgi:hypothetical protein
MVITIGSLVDEWKTEDFEKRTASGHGKITHKPDCAFLKVRPSFGC